MSEKYHWLIYWSFLHFLIDATSIYIVFSTLSHFHLAPTASINNILAYNFIAFTVQMPLGLIADKYKAYELIIIISLIIQLASIMLTGRFILAPIFMTGFANALFHVGAGSLVLTLFRQTATHIGLFVAPGALGVMIGNLMAGSPYFLYIISLILLFLIPVQITFRMSTPPKNESGIKIGHLNLKLLIILLLSIILFRSMAGSSLVFIWKKGTLFIMLMALSSFLGKSLGGIIADKWGYTTIGIGSLLLSIPFILTGNVHPILGLTGMLLFQMTAAVTISFLYNLMPNKPGFSFGMTTVMLFIGSLPFVYQSANATNLFPSLINAVSATIFGIVGLIYLCCDSPLIRARIKL